MSNDNALTEAAQTAVSGGQADNLQPAEELKTTEGTQEGQQTGQEASDKDGEGESQSKKEKTPEQREIERLRRGIDRRTRQLYELRAQIPQGVASRQEASDNRSNANDSEPLSLTRAELAQMVKAEAERLAPTLQQEKAEVERRQGVIQSLEKTWGQDRFNELASDLDDAMGGLTDRSGRPKPAIEAVFEADEPARVIEYLADPDNADEAEKIARMSAAQAGKAIARLEDRIKAQSKSEKAAPKASKAPAPLEAVRGGGNTSGAPDPSDTKAWIRWRNEQEFKGR